MAKQLKLNSEHLEELIMEGKDSLSVLEEYLDNLKTTTDIIIDQESDKVMGDFEEVLLKLQTEFKEFLTNTLNETFYSIELAGTTFCELETEYEKNITDSYEANSNNNGIHNTGNMNNGGIGANGQTYVEH